MIHKIARLTWTRTNSVLFEKDREHSSFTFFRKALPFMLVMSALVMSACSSSDSVNETDTSDPDVQLDADMGDQPTDADAGSEPINADTGDEPIVDDSMQAGNAGSLAFVAGRTPSYDAGQIEKLTLGETIVSSGAYPATKSDILVRTDGEYVYELGRFQINTLTRFSLDELTTANYQYSVLGDDQDANPYDLVFVDSTKAYLIRYGSGKVWIINPSAETEAGLKIGELDISAYDVDGVPEASDALLVGDRLYILMERLENFQPVKNGYIAVFDTTTDTEIETGLGDNGLPGIALSTTNPATMQYVSETDEVLVIGRGNINEREQVPGDPYQGGIESVSVDDGIYTLDMLLDDGDEADNKGFFRDAITVNQTRGYIVTYAGWEDTTLRSYNPTTGLLEEGVVAGLENLDITTLAVGPEGRLWVGLGGDEPGFTLIDPVNNSVFVDKVDTEFVPINVVFVSQ